MTALSFIGRIYLEIALSGSCAYLLFHGLYRLGAGKMPARVTQRAWLNLARALWVCALVFPLLLTSLGEDQLPRPAIQISPSGSGLVKQALWKIEPKTNLQLSLSVPNQFFTEIPYALGLFALANAFLGLVLYLKRRQKLKRYLASLPQTKTYRQIRLCFSDQERVAFSTRLSRVNYLVFPKSYLFDPTNLKLALKHEGQHHRQGDTGWIWFLELWTQSYRWSPFTRLWNSEMETLQELACDEALIVRQRVSPLAYGHCLLRAAEIALESRVVLAGTTSMARTSHGLNLKRRVEMLNHFNENKTKSRKAPLVLVWLGTLGLLATSAYAVRATIGTRGLTMDEAKSVFGRKTHGTEIPLNLNELVLDRLNHYLGTEKGRTFMKESRARMPQYQEMIQRKIEEYGLPPELIAIPLWESGFLNSAISPGQHARGIWQFIAQTAKRYGLAVNETVDERIDPLKETDAAMRYLRDLHDRFGDWRLAMKAYNEGEWRVEGLIVKYNTRDAWELERLDSRENYLSGATAMMLLLRHPELIK